MIWKNLNSKVKYLFSKLINFICGNPIKVDFLAFTLLVVYIGVLKTHFFWLFLVFLVFMLVMAILLVILVNEVVQKTKKVYVLYLVIFVFCILSFCNNMHYMGVYHSPMSMNALLIIFLVVFSNYILKK